MTPGGGRGTFAAYLGVSVVALLVDVVALYLLAFRLAMDRPLAAAIAYLAGLVVHYALAVNFVFRHRRFGRHPAAEFTSYALTGLLGVVISYLVILAGDRVGASLWAAKSAAVVVSFLLTYAARKWLLFSPSRDGIGHSSK